MRYKLLQFVVVAFLTWAVGLYGAGANSDTYSYSHAVVNPKSNPNTHSLHYS